MLFIAATLAAAAVYFFAIDGVAAEVYWDVCVAAMLAVGFCVASRFQTHRAAWILILSGQACFLVGDVIFAVLEYVYHSDASPNVGDISYVAGYPFLAVGLVVLLRSRDSSRDAGGVIDGFIVATGAAVMLWVFFVGPLAFDHTLSVPARLIDVAYPAGDLLLIAIGAQFAVRQVRRQTPYWIMTVALLALLVADLGYLYQSGYGSYSAGDPVDFGWWISYALIVAVLMHPRVGEIAAAPELSRPRLTPRRIVVLSLVVVASPVTIAIRFAVGADLQLPALLGGTVALFGLVVIRLVMMARQLEASHGLLQHEASHDALTGLGNRTLFGQQVALSLAAGTPASVLFLDLDDFKSINDSLGHPAGDLVLQVVGKRLAGLARPTDSVARLGGDEFAMLVCGPDVEAGVAAARRVLQALSEPIGFPDGRTVRSNVSVGIAHSSIDSSVEALLRNADIAMYLAKQLGKGRAEVFQPGMGQAVMDRLEMRAELAEALTRNEFVLQYQPIVEVSSGRPVGVEALLRWDHPGRGRVEPTVFIPVAEETGLIIPIGRWVLNEACRRAVELDPRPDGLEMSVNVSAVQLRSPDLVDDVRCALATSGLDPSRLVLELTESTVIEDLDAAAVTLRELRTLGVRIALDDFGTGFASLQHLRAFPIDVVKLDRSFVMSCMGHDSTMLSSMIAMAADLGMTTVGEGVEEPSQLDMLREMRCVYAQGFLIAEPIASDRLDDVYSLGDASECADTVESLLTVST